MNKQENKYKKQNYHKHALLPKSASKEALGIPNYQKRTKNRVKSGWVNLKFGLSQIGSERTKPVQQKIAKLNRARRCNTVRRERDGDGQW